MEPRLRRQTISPNYRKQPYIMSYAEETALLSRLDLFSGLPNSELKRLVLSSERYTLEEGEYLFRQGDTSDTVYVIIEGALAVYLDTGGNRNEIAERVTGEVVGEIAAITGVKRSASLQAKQRTELIGINGPLFIQTVTENPQAALLIMKVLSERLTALSQTGTGSTSAG